jgi:hypothetical protein
MTICSRCHGTLFSCHCWQALLRKFSDLHALGAVSHDPDWSGGFLWRWDLLSPTTFYPCGLNHPSPDSLCVLRRELEGLWEATPSIRRLLHGPGSLPGRLHQDQGREVTQYRNTAYASIRRLLHGPGSLPGRLHQDQGREVTQYRNTAYASLSAAPSGMTPVLRKRHRAMSNLRATATIPIRLRRLPPPPKRSRNQQLSALSG